MFMHTVGGSRVNPVSGPALATPPELLVSPINYLAPCITTLLISVADGSRSKSGVSLGEDFVNSAQMHIPLKSHSGNSTESKEKKSPPAEARLSGILTLCS